MDNSNTENYGKCPGNPVRLNSIPASRLFLNNLVTTDGDYIIYHRKGSVMENSEIIDHYEIFTTAKQYDDIYISIYNRRNSWVPPAGYLFEDGILCPDLTEDDDDMAEIIESVLQGIDKKYFYEDQRNIEDFMLSIAEGDELNSFIECSAGVNFELKNFPVSYFKSYLHTFTFLSDEKQFEMLKKIPKREKGNLTN
ncbi:MAG TPA: hypothetical protein ENN90_08175 [Mariniphaga anaerophila]|uniref:Uncharacterized protein n=1 Tax=Mariniphaga anaerophila TaxID=1484053 RepID=A0A831LHE4_9BACT|nr:hypothetical protein [Mariniphaga anaerophila]